HSAAGEATRASIRGSPPTERSAKPDPALGHRRAAWLARPKTTAVSSPVRPNLLALGPSATSRAAAVPLARGLLAAPRVAIAPFHQRAWRLPRPAWRLFYRRWLAGATTIPLPSRVSRPPAPHAATRQTASAARACVCRETCD